MSGGRAFWLGEPSRFATFSRGRARAALLILALLLALSLTALAVADPEASTAVSSPDGQTDLMLYEKIVAGMKGGGDYYTVAIDAMRTGGYPLQPFFTVRMPGLAVLQAGAPGRTTNPLRLAAAAGSHGAACRRGECPGPPRIAACAAARPMLASPGGMWPSRNWRGAVALSLALRRPGRGRKRRQSRWGDVVRRPTPVRPRHGG